MAPHIFLPQLDISQHSLAPEHSAWLTEWLGSVEAEAERGDIAASTCLQGTIAEIVLHGRPQTDWVGIMEQYLTREGMPLAYSEEYGKRLYGFTAFWIQTEVHAVHARWWIEVACAEGKLDYGNSLDFRDIVETMRQPSGWIYNPQVSCTGIRTRMKSEYLMSLAMGIEILEAYGGLKEGRGSFEGLLSSESLTSYLGAEYFRLYSLNMLGAPELAPVDLAAVLISCEIGDGYCDFDVKSKVDDYMGTAKRAGRDIAVHSALSSLHALSISHACSDKVQEHVSERISHFGEHLRNNPMDIQPFKMRELDIPFGPGLSPLEVLAASEIMSR